MRRRAAARPGWSAGTGGQEYEAVADPPGEFRVLAMTRAARYPVEHAEPAAPSTPAGAASPCLVLRRGRPAGLRLRLCRPDPDAVAATGAQCYERGVYEAWAPAPGDDRADADAT